MGRNDLSELVRGGGRERVIPESDKQEAEAIAKAANARNGVIEPVVDDATEASNLRAGLEAGLCTISELIALKIKPRLKLLADWFREGDLGFIRPPGTRQDMAGLGHLQGDF